jgi:hypothetical protein
LDISNNKVDAEGFCQLTHALRYSTTLEWLNASGNDLRVEVPQRLMPFQNFIGVSKSL